MAVGFREDFSYLYDPLEGYDLPTTPSNKFIYKPLFPAQEEIPEPVVIPQDNGGDLEDNRPYYNTPTGRVYDQGDGSFTYDNKQAFAPGSIPSELAWGAYNFGKDMPDWAQAVVPGVQAAQFLGGLALNNQIDAIDTQFDRLTPPDLQPNNYNFNKKNLPQNIPASNLTVVTDMNGNVYYTEKGSKKEQELEEKAVKNSLIENLKELGIDVKDLKDLSLTELQNKVKNIPDIPSFNISGQPIDAWIPGSDTPVTQITNQYTTDNDFDQGGKEEGYGGEISQSQIDSYADQGFDTWGMAAGGYVGPLGNRR